MALFVIATRNQHKADEIRNILTGPHLFRTLRDFPGAPTVREDAATFAGNAIKKAAELADWLVAGRDFGWGDPEADVRVMADDSGLEVVALGRAPGVNSARFAAMDAATAHNSSDVENNAKLIRLLADVPPEMRTARFHCVLAVIPIGIQTSATDLPLQHPSESSWAARAELFEGTCSGRIVLTPAGKGGFGYDPLFIPDGYNQSFAELDESVKNQISHRARAIAKLRSRLSAGQRFVSGKTDSTGTAGSYSR